MAFAAKARAFLCTELTQRDSASSSAHQASSSAHNLVHIVDGGSEPSRHGIVFSHNTLINNTVRPPYDLLYMSLRDEPEPGHRILNNVFRDNAYDTSVTDTWALSVALYASLEDSDGLHNYTIAGNVFDNPLLPYEVTVSTGDCSSGHKLDLRLNYWGQPDMTAAAVEARLNDGLKERGLCLVSFDSYFLESPEPFHLDDSACITQPGHCGLAVASVAAASLLDGDVLQGDVVDQNVVIPAGTYRMTGNVIIGANANVTFQAGAHVTVEGDYEILVVGGTISMEGSAESPVVMQGVRSGNHAAGTFLACTAYSSSELNAMSYFDSGITVESCTAACADAGYVFAGLFSTRCACGNEAARFGLSDRCGYACGGNAGQVCGGSNSFSVYHTGRASRWGGVSALPQARGVTMLHTELRDTGGVRSSREGLKIEGPVPLHIDGLRLTAASSTGIYLTSSTALL